MTVEVILHTVSLAEGGTVTPLEVIAARSA